MRGPEAIEKDLNRLLATSRRPFDRERLEHTLVVVEREIGRWLEATEHLLRARRIANDLGVSASAQGATATELALVAYERSDKTEASYLLREVAQFDVTQLDVQDRVVAQLLSNALGTGHHFWVSDFLVRGLLEGGDLLHLGVQGPP